MQVLPEHHRSWEQWSGHLSFNANEVSVWRIPVPEKASSLSSLARLLDDQEQHRASAMRLSQPRSEFITARAKLRTLLGVAFKCEPQAIRFTANEYGRPSVDLLAAKPGNAAAPVHFSISHSGGLVLLALAAIPEIGVDLEYRRPFADYLNVAKSFFAADEYAALDAGGGTDAFFRCWTRKEAVVKATGRGLSLPLSDFSVSVQAEEPARVIAWQQDGAEAARWSLLDCNPGPEFAASLAVRLRSPVVHWFDWPIE